MIDDDDFAGVVEVLRGADAVVFATPVYYGSLSESMRAFTDRLRRICGHAADRAGMANKPAIGVCVAGGGGGGAPSCTVSLERVLRTCGFDLVDLVPVRRQNLDVKLEILQITGRWLATCPMPNSVKCMGSRCVFAAGWSSPCTIPQQRSTRVRSDRWWNEILLACRN